MEIQPYVRPLHFRVYAPSDFDSCVALYASNEPGRVPPGYRSEFEEWLGDGKSLILVAESEGEPVACGGVAYFSGRQTAGLMFGIVHAKHHRRGFGTTLLAARLALLEPENCGCNVGMQVTSASFSFYRRYGFNGFIVTRDARGYCFCNFTRLVTPADAAACREALAIAGAVLPGTFKIPLDPR